MGSREQLSSEPSPNLTSTVLTLCARLILEPPSIQFALSQRRNSLIALLRKLTQICFLRTQGSSRLTCSVCGQTKLALRFSFLVGIYSFILICDFSSKSTSKRLPCMLRSAWIWELLTLETPTLPCSRTSLTSIPPSSNRGACRAYLLLEVIPVPILPHFSILQLNLGTSPQTLLSLRHLSVLLGELTLGFLLLTMLRISTIRF